MVSATETAKSQQQYREKGWFSKTIGLPFALLGILLISLFFSIMTEWIGLYFFWPEEGWHHSRDMLNSELEWISKSFPQSLLIQDPDHTARWLIGFIYEWCFEKTALIEWIKLSSVQARMNSSKGGDLQYYLGLAYVQIENYGLASLYAALTYLARLLILTLTIPLFLMAAFTGLVDGLVRRDLRRFGAGRESGFIYHRAKMLIMPLLVAPWLIYPALPMTVNPILILLPNATALGFIVSISAGSFKKYL
ncbi:TIGR03747 family integrating conjugative element membrane protein [Pseudomonas sp. Y39-6]|uniref:TIGR03747 family integrating conjugative element membrane protein n=1 Tax=Pseudomonas sp. Y39-6 TaxID=2749807 RepID=UPI00191084C5|nr:TIGR03747 family integrating conjugative element membrane protein [Pseudomonas sp. Y39-6]QPO21982.1 TIGR03747 family integrating conjugative element membrane protein [Pseudomonas sp. Y39-6]URS59303.1 TIGR03747 family integrating conjugative element membrane protein [Pseudomonas sp. Y39-6]